MQNDEQRGKLRKMVLKASIEQDNLDLALGYLRYEALRKIKGFEFTTLIGRNLHGENFDEMVDALVLGGTVMGNISTTEHKKREV